MYNIVYLDGFFIRGVSEVRSHLDEIIKRLGYTGSPYLKYRSEKYDALNMSPYTIKILSILSPYAVYIVDGEPFILFYDESSNIDERKEVYIKIWNAQIPVVIFCGTATISIFNGCTIDVKNYSLVNVDKIDYKSLDEINENTSFSLMEIANQDFWINYRQKYSGKKLYDVMLDNLEYLTNRLKNDFKVSYTTKLVLRLIFIRYLIDRSVDLDYPGFSSDVISSRASLLELLDDIDSLYALFSYLKDKFNGNLFEQDNENAAEMTADVLYELKSFLSADAHLKQLSLFELYDFYIIPVELISNIYEILLGKETQAKDNAFYTPKYLTDYILDNTIGDHIRSNNDCTILDPSCGSGIFLVNSYRRMIEKKLNGEPYTENDELLCDTLTKYIYGIDFNSEAIDVAIFSLYLAVLDYKNPKTLKQFHLPPLKNTNLLACDFFDVDKLASLQQNVSFDFIIGNPPWSNKPGRHVDYCKNNGYEQYLQNNDTCRSFILRSKDFCMNNKNTICCFVLKSKLLYMQKKPSIKFRKYLLNNTKIIRLIEMSSVRKLVFKNSNAPAIVFSYEFSDKNTENNRFEYISMKMNEYYRFFKIIAIEKTDVKSVQQKLLIENDWAWKTLVYGLAGDIDNIIKLKSKTKTVLESIEEKHPLIIKGNGVKYNDGDKKDSRHLQGSLLLNSNKAIDHFIINNINVSTFTKESIDRPRNKALFHAPYCLVMHGVDMKDYTMKAVYSENDYIFHDAIYAIKGSYEQKKFLLNTVGLMNSKLYSYFNLMLGSFIGIEREVRKIDEVLSFPFIFNKNIAKQVEHIQEKKKIKDNLFDNEDASQCIEDLNNTIFELFELSNNEFVDYALHIQIPQLTGADNNNADRKVNNNDFIIYMQYFYNYFSEIYASANKYIHILIYPNLTKYYSAIEVRILDNKQSNDYTIIHDIDDSQKIMLTKLSMYKTNDLFYSLKDIIYFEDNSFCIIKPNKYRNWHPAIAKIDIMEVTDRILAGQNEDKQ